VNIPEELPPRSFPVGIGLITNKLGGQFGALIQEFPPSIDRKPPSPQHAITVPLGRTFNDEMS
jgi:hypothetical protein